MPTQRPRSSGMSTPHAAAAAAAPAIAATEDQNASLSMAMVLYLEKHLFNSARVIRRVLTTSDDVPAGFCLPDNVRVKSLMQNPTSPTDGGSPSATPSWHVTEFEALNELRITTKSLA